MLYPIAAVLVLLSSASAFAVSERLVYECARTPFGGDEGYEVSIKAQAGGRFRATLHVIDPGGKRDVRSYAVKRTTASPNRPEGTEVFSGRNFLLQLHHDQGPTEDGLIPASLSALDQFELRLEEWLVCEKRSR
ncbi:MAG: hypothetical protein NDJ89_17575 [Oligoflexia bacterium]|nr:hypothetical protein [Oligoflexia bacterium]